MAQTDSELAKREIAERNPGVTRRQSLSIVDQKLLNLLHERQRRLRFYPEIGVQIQNLVRDHGNILSFIEDHDFPTRSSYRTSMSKDYILNSISD